MFAYEDSVFGGGLGEPAFSGGRWWGEVTRIN